MNFASENDFNSIIIDTAGRLQIDDSMMTEMVRIKEVSNYKPLTKSTNFHDLFENPKIYLTVRGFNDVSLTNSPEFFNILSR